MKEKREMQEKSVAFLTLGCKVNSYETDGMEQLFLEAGYKIIDFGNIASIYVINTCTVTNIADRKSRQMLHKAKKTNPDGIVVAVGCYAQASKEILEVDGAIDIIVGNNQKKNIVTIIEQYFENTLENKAIINIDKEQEYEELTIESVGEKTRAYIKIQDGCNQFCSYCIIPYARGRARSRKLEDVIAEVKRIAIKGYKEVVLTGIHLSSYGIDFKNMRTTKEQLDIKEDQDISNEQDISNDQDIKENKNTNELEIDYQPAGIEYHNQELLDLILAISNVDGIERIRLGSLEPRIITEQLVHTLSDNHKFCPHFHLSLQSGCNTILKRMNRRYSVEEYYEKCELIRKYFDNPAITTDIIVGFPGETQEEFEESKVFLEKVSFAQMHIFKYSKRKGTKAERMPDQVEEQIKQTRSNLLMELDIRLNHEYQQHFINKIEKILVEEEIEIEGVKYQIGHNERYQRIAFVSEKDCTNQIVLGKIIGNLTKDILICKICIEF